MCRIHYFFSFRVTPTVATSLALAWAASFAASPVRRGRHRIANYRNRQPAFPRRLDAELRDPSASSGRSPPKRACGSRLSHRSRRQQVRNTPPQHTHTSLCAHNRRTHIMIKSHLYNLSSHLQIGLRRASLWWVCVSAWTQGLGSSSSKWRSCTRCSSLIGSAEGSTPSGTTTSLGSALGCAAAPSASGCCSASPLK